MFFFRLMDNARERESGGGDEDDTPVDCSE